MKQRMIKAGVLLLGLMVIFTIISRAAYDISTAEVSTKKPEPQTFTPDVSARGTVAGRKEIAVSAVENLRVGSVHVMEGQAMEAGQRRNSLLWCRKSRRYMTRQCKTEMNLYIRRKKHWIQRILERQRIIPRSRARLHEGRRKRRLPNCRR